VAERQLDDPARHLADVRLEVGVAPDDLQLITAAAQVHGQEPGGVDELLG
jgi:hypothetical protein